MSIIKNLKDAWNYIVYGDTEGPEDYAKVFPSAHGGYTLYRIAGVGSKATQIGVYARRRDAVRGANRRGLNVE